MAKSRSRKGDAKGEGSSPADAWLTLTWDDLGLWAGGSAVTRGRSYQRDGRVRDLRVTADGAILATVVGGEQYTTTVAPIGGGGRPSLESACTCPVGIACKHAVAAVAEYLQAVADGRDVPAASEDDPRWEELASGGDEARESRGDGHPSRPGVTRKEWDEKIERHLRAKSQGELADLVWSLARRFPEVYDEFRERIALQEGDVGRLVAEARREIGRVTAEPAWRNGWDGDGHTPDYSRIRHRLERLLDLGHADEVVSLGRELIPQGLRQVRGSHDEGETAMAFSACMPVVFQAVARSRLSAPERLLFAIDAELADDYDALGDATLEVFDAPAAPADWSEVADTLSARLKAAPASEKDEEDWGSFSRNYERDRVADWIARALREAGREGELRTLYESEARATGSYERLVKYLMEEGHSEDTARWASEGIAAVGAQYPGIADHLAGVLRELARKQKRWDLVAAHAARPFFERPSPSGFDELMKAAKKAKVEAPVRAAALRFLETGAAPYRVIPPPPAKGKSPRTGASGRGGRRSPTPPPRATEEAAPVRVVIDPTWPLPVPDEFLPLLDAPRRFDPGPRPHLDVLLEMAIAAREPDEVLRWFDKMCAEAKRSGYGHGAPPYADRVASAVSDAYPERAIEIYRAALDAHLPHAQQSSYESSAGYLKKLRPIFGALGKAGEWDALVTSIREKYRNRPRFMEILDRLDPRPIVHEARKRRT